MSDYPSRKGNGDGLYWLIALGLMVTGVAAPIGVLMIVMKLLGSGSKRGRHPYYEQQRSEHTGARTTGLTAGEPMAPKASKAQVTGQKAPAIQKKLDALARKSKLLTILGAVITAVFGIALPSALGEVFYWLFAFEPALAVDELFNAIPVLCFLGGGIGCLWAGLRKRKQLRRFRNYLAMVGRQPSVSVSALSSAIGRSPSQVRDDLADMLDAGLFPQGFLDYGGDRLVLTGDGIAEAPRPERAAPPPEADENAILAEIRAINDAIDNEKLSAQIDRVGVITARILDYQKSHPEKEAELHSFLNYYLPTTLKILRTYAQLEDQEVSGQNITAAMERIENMMDKAVDGFEKQLDRLFQGDAMDITADVEVLERMLAKDGLSDQEGLTLEL